MSLGWTGFEHEALAARSPVAFGSLRVPIASAEDLIIFKVVAAREIDLQDAKTLLTLYPKIDLARIRKRVRELAELMEEPGRVTMLERMVRDPTIRSGKRALAPSRRKAKPKSTTASKKRTPRKAPARSK